jgi:hypothetical protein
VGEGATTRKRGLKLVDRLVPLGLLLFEFWKEASQIIIMKTEQNNMIKGETDKERDGERQRQRATETGHRGTKRVKQDVCVKQERPGSGMGVSDEEGDATIDGRGDDDERGLDGGCDGVDAWVDGLDGEEGAGEGARERGDTPTSDGERVRSGLRGDDEGMGDERA